MPGYPLQEEDKVIFQELLCEYCETVVRDALKAKCGHFYCRSCVEHLFRENPGAVFYCKKTRIPLFHFQVILKVKFLPDERFSTEVESATVRCLFLEEGCTWKGQLRESENHVGSCILASIQRGGQKLCEGCETLSTEIGGEGKSLHSGIVVECQVGTKPDEDLIDEDSYAQGPMPAQCREAQGCENPQKQSPTWETGAFPKIGINLYPPDFCGLVGGADPPRMETRRPRHEEGSANAFKNHSSTKGTGDRFEGGMTGCQADLPVQFENEPARRLETRRFFDEQGNANVVEKEQINANLPRQVNYLAGKIEIAGQNRNSAENSLELKEMMNPPASGSTITRNSPSSQNLVPRVSDLHYQRFIDLENKVAHQDQIIKHNSILIQHLVLTKDQYKQDFNDLKYMMRGMFNRVTNIQATLISHQMKHDDLQANLNTLRNDQSDLQYRFDRLLVSTPIQRDELARLIRNMGAIQEKMRRLEDHMNAHGTMLRNISDSVRDLATAVRNVRLLGMDITNV